MDDGSLLVFGCGVSFLALAGAYVYLRESFAGREESTESEWAGVDPRPPEEVRDATP